MRSLTPSPSVAAPARHLPLPSPSLSLHCSLSSLGSVFAAKLMLKLIKEMDYVKGGLGWKVWGAALVLSKKLLSLQKSFQDKRVIELGSGCGLCGLLVAKLGACEVVLTDYEPEILTNLGNNALLLPASVLEPEQLGQSTTKMGSPEVACDYTYDELASHKRPAIIRVRILDWAEDASSFLEEKELSYPFWPNLSSDERFDWVIGSDLIYNHYNIKSLVGVINCRLSKQGGQGLFAAPVREKEWEACMELLEVEEGGTLHGVDHYEGGIVIIHVTHKL
ncbi:hypothetical protein GOP47_0022546 [Adiantum capillus-veneris]|uniref:Uncharacterized protein n=1 Tax=Adiantum capillus-veneris TaxID=13818 RepID=A0A9D4U6N8_ADICA|nr:hypothetical protein GOP47_0022546 [Adiantum capillus-veneris]